MSMILSGRCFAYSDALYVGATSSRKFLQNPQRSVLNINSCNASTGTTINKTNINASNNFFILFSKQKKRDRELTPSPSNLNKQPNLHKVENFELAIVRVCTRTKSTTKRVMSHSITSFESDLRLECILTHSTNHL